jgi:uncharacterized protein involved in response to NO
MFKVNVMTLLTIDEPTPPASGHNGFAQLPVWRLGFRPFYLLAAGFAALAIPLWIARYSGALQGLSNAGLHWHMHEMVFGMAIAVIVGFLFTAGRNWTGLWTPRGTHLAALAGLWVAGRVAMLFAPPLLAAAVDIAFLPAAAWPLYRVLHRAGNKRNMFLIVLLAALTAANAVFHAAVLGWIAINPAAAVQAAILVIVMIESVIGGRVIPGFTANAVPGTKPVTDVKRDRIALTVTAVAAISWIAGLPAPFVAAMATAAACAQLLRLAGWESIRTLRNPLLWILHLSYAWIPIGFFLLAFAQGGAVSSSAAFHALTVGSMAGLIIGMITRTALGHTGRMLKSGHAELAMYLLVQAGAVVRVCVAVHPSASWAPVALQIAAACWSAGFALYLAIYAPYLWRARIDGKEG